MSVWWVVLIAGVIAVLIALFNGNPTVQAPLNASGYTYPSSPGA